MSEQEIREGMLLAVWDEPPLDFDPDTLIRRVEQKKSRRRALVAVGVATAMIAVASLSLPSLLQRDRDSQLGAETHTSSSAPPQVQSSEKKAQLVGDKLVERLGVQMTNFKELYASFNPGRNPVYPPYQTRAPQWEGERDYSGYLYLTDEIGPTALRVMVYTGSFSKNNFCSGASSCQDMKTMEDGSIVYGAEFNQGTSKVQQSGVARKFDTGLVVEITAYAYNPSNGNGQRETVPVGVPVLTQLVTDPAIAW